MNVLDVIKKRHSIRLYEDRKVDVSTLKQLLAVLGLYPSAANLQPIKYFVVQSDDDLKTVQESVHWAGYLPSFVVTTKNQPQTYILVLGDKEIAGSHEFAAGAAVTSLSIAATGLGLGTCCLGIKKQHLIYSKIGIDPEKYVVMYAVALGYSAQTVRNVPMFDGNVRYYIDGKGDWCVPKRASEEIIINYDLIYEDKAITNPE